MKMQFIVLIILLVVFVGYVYVSRSQNVGKGINMNRLLEDEVCAGKRIIKITNMSEDEVNKAIEDFMALHSQDGGQIKKPVIKREGNALMLYLEGGTSYDLFCFWVNYLVYSNKDKRHNDDVVGWYEVSPEAKGVWLPFANQALMFFIPATDSEFDNVYFVTKRGECYKQEFAHSAPLIKQEGTIRRYETW